MDLVTLRSSHFYWLMVSRSYRPKTTSTLSPTTQRQYGRRSPAPAALSSLLDIRMAALSSQQPARTSAWWHLSTYVHSPLRRVTQRLSTRPNIPPLPSSNTSKLWMGGFGCARRASQNSLKTCRRRSSNSSGPLRWHLWLISLSNPFRAQRGSINRPRTSSVLMTGPFNLNCSASWRRVSMRRSPKCRQATCRCSPSPSEYTTSSSTPRLTSRGATARKIWCGASIEAGRVSDG